MPRVHVIDNLVSVVRSIGTEVARKARYYSALVAQVTQQRFLVAVTTPALRANKVATNVAS